MLRDVLHQWSKVLAEVDVKVTVGQLREIALAVSGVAADLHQDPKYITNAKAHVGMVRS